MRRRRYTFLFHLMGALLKGYISKSTVSMLTIIKKGHISISPLPYNNVLFCVISCCVTYERCRVGCAVSICAHVLLLAHQCVAVFKCCQLLVTNNMPFVIPWRIPLVLRKEFCIYHVPLRGTRYSYFLANACLRVYEYTRTCNPMPTVPSRSVNSCLHSGVPEIASSKRKLAFGRTGCQRLLKIANHKHNFHHWYWWPKWRIKVTLAKNVHEKQKLSPLVTLGKNDQAKVSPMVSLAKNDQDKPKLSPLVSLVKNDKEKQKLLPFLSLAKNDKEKTKLSPLVSLPKNAQNQKLSALLSLAKNDQEKQKLSPLQTLVKNDEEKTKTFTVGILGRKG